MKKCSLCRRDLPYGGGPHCDKCKKNEAKYGKPTNCKYCQLPAAFVENRCVHCAYSERKHGPPIPCSRCQLKAAFARDDKRPASTVLCRLCHAVHGSSSSRQKRASHEKDGSAKKPRLDHHSSHSRHNSLSLSTATPTANAALPSTSAPQEDVQKYKDQIEELKNAVSKKNVTIRDLQEKIGQLGAETMAKERDLKQRLANLQKQSDSTIVHLQDQLKQANKELTGKRTQK